VATSSSPAATSSHQRRRSSISPGLTTLKISPTSDAYATTSGLGTGRFGHQLETVPGTPGLPHMSLSRSPSPQRGGGWSSPGLTTPYDGSSRQPSPARSYANGSANNVTWATAQAKSAEIRGYPSFSPKNQSFTRHFRKLSTKLPYFRGGDYSDKEKLGRGRWSATGMNKIQDILAFLGRIIWRMRLRFACVFAFLLLVIIFYVTRECSSDPP
jgi:mannan polymerase II complex MNN10 subunit